MRASTLAAMVGLALSVTPAAAQERFTDVVGGSGGQQFIARCPANTVVTGVLALTGAYVNGIAPICDGRQGPGFGGSGDKRSAECPAGSSIKTLTIVLLRSDNHLVKNLQLQCADRRTGIDTATVPLSTPGRMTAPWSDGFLTNAHYPSGVLTCDRQDVVGLQGRSGVSLDALGLICNSPVTH